MKKYLIYTIVALIFAAWLYGLYIYYGQIDSGLVFLAMLLTVFSSVLIPAVKDIIWRVQNGVDLFATLQSDPEKVKQDMLFLMQYGHNEGIKGKLRELNAIFRNYPQFELQKWEVFRAWYKNLIDHALENPDIYVLTMKDGDAYDTDKDPLYDPEAPDWARFDRKRYYDDDDDDDEDDFLDDSKNKKDSAMDWIYRGMGFGLMNSILSGGSDGGGSSDGGSGIN